MKKQLAKVIAVAILALLVVTALAACNNASKQVPVYQGMTVSNSPALYAYAGNGGGD